MLYYLKCILVCMVCISLEYGAEVFCEDDANENIKLIIKTIKAINVDPYWASENDIRLCVGANFYEEEGWGDSDIQLLCEQVKEYIDQKALQARRQ